MWVRSQNKECLLKCNTINIATKEETNGYIIFEYIGNDDYVNLGVYKSKERALEILDEIQTEISNYVGTMAQIVYEMPEE